MDNFHHVILGIDPGSILMGYAIIDVRADKPALINMDILKLSMIKDIYERLGMIHKKICLLIEEHKPTSFAIEAPFYGKNVQSMLKLGRAQGVAIAAAMQAGISVIEYSPRKIKQSITGKGTSDKEQVWKMLQQILALDKRPEYFDASDAVAVALCHYYQIKSPVKKTALKGNSWNEFIKNNPGRLKK